MCLPTDIASDHGFHIQKNPGGAEMEAPRHECEGKALHALGIGEEVEGEDHGGQSQNDHLNCSSRKGESIAAKRFQ